MPQGSMCWPFTWIVTRVYRRNEVRKRGEVLKSRDPSDLWDLVGVGTLSRKRCLKECSDAERWWFKTRVGRGTVGRGGLGQGWEVEQSSVNQLPSVEAPSHPFGLKTFIFMYTTVPRGCGLMNLYERFKYRVEAGR